LFAIGRLSPPLFPPFQLHVFFLAIVSLLEGPASSGDTRTTPLPTPCFPEVPSSLHSLFFFFFLPLVHATPLVGTSSFFSFPPVKASIFLFFFHFRHPPQVALCKMSQSSRLFFPGAFFPRVPPFSLPYYVANFLGSSLRNLERSGFNSPSCGIHFSPLSIQYLFPIRPSLLFWKRRWSIYPPA